eukprot:c27512_g1_i3 orf=605-1552(-)
MVSTIKQKTPKKMPSMPSLSMPSAAISQDLARKSGIQQGGEIPSQLGDASCSCSEADVHPDENSDNDSEICDLVLDGAKEDEILQGADALTEEEVARRRVRRVRQLIKLYRMHYWALMEELRAKYRIFYLRNGKSGWRDEAEISEKEREGVFHVPEQGGNDTVRTKLEEGGTKVLHAPERAANESMRCSYQGCKAKPLALSSFCFSHIVFDARQQLYKPCTYISRSGQNGPLTCGKPVLRAMVPSFCPTHFQQAQKQAARSFKKSGLGVSTSTSKPALKLHLIVAEYVRLIQITRRNTVCDSALKSTGGNADNDT